MKDSAIVQRLHMQHNNFANKLRSETSLKIEENFKGQKHCTPLPIACDGLRSVLPVPSPDPSLAMGCVPATRYCPPQDPSLAMGYAVGTRVERYYKEVVAMDLVLQCCVNTVMEIVPPRKIVISTSSKRMIQDKKQLVVGLSALKMISGQKSRVTRARRSIAAFKLREGSVLGCKVTLRGKVMYSFLNKLLFLVLPRAGPSLINQRLDANGNYNIGISDPFLFVELESHYDFFQSLCGIDVALVIPPLAKGSDRPPANQKAMVALLLSGLQMQCANC